MPDSLSDIVRNPSLENLRAGRLSLSTTIRSIVTVDIARMLKSCGYDALYVDLEHGMVDLQACHQICVAALDVGITALVRLPGHDVELAGKVLDGGAMGIIAPHVNNAEEAKRMVAACKYPPLGHRSMNDAIPQWGYRKWDAADATAVLNDATMVVPQIETEEAVRNVDAIAAVAGVDMLLIGTNDLVADMGLHGQLDHDKVEWAYKEVIAACDKHGKYCGVGGFGAREDLIEKYVKLGGRYVSAGSDQGFFLAAARARADAIGRMQP